MPYLPLTPCRAQGCSRLTHGRYCEEHQRLDVADRYRPSASKRGYNSRWQRARKLFLSRNPLCAECEKQGKYVQATVVDHIVPHKGDQTLFWDEDNWQPLCKRCHDRKTVLEDGGFGNKIKCH